MGLADLVRRGEISAAELLDEALARTAAVNPKINAVIHLMEGRAREAIAAGLPDGPFRGVPFLLKDLMTAYAGEPMRFGSRLFRDYVPDDDEELIRRYRPPGWSFSARPTRRSSVSCNVTEPELFGPTPQSLEPRAHLQWFERRFRRGGRRTHRAGGPRQRRRRLDPHPGVVLRPVRA